MITFITVVYVLVCVFLILVVLLQAGRGGGMGAAMGGSSQTVFGGAGASNFLQRLTVISASLFMILSATLAYLSSSGEQALERADERIRAREEARKVESKEPGEKVAAAAIDAGLSSLPELSTPTLLQEPTEGDAPEAAPEEAAPEAEGESAADEATQDAIAEEAPSAETASEAEPAAPKPKTKKAVVKKAIAPQKAPAPAPAATPEPAPEAAPAPAVVPTPVEAAPTPAE